MIRKAMIRRNRKRLLEAFPIIAAVATILPVHASGITSSQWNGSGDIDALMGYIIGMMLAIARYAGMGLTIWGIIKTVMAYKDDNTNEITQGIRLAVVGIVLVALKSILGSGGLGLIS